MSSNLFLQLSFAPLVIGLLAANSCAILGNFLLLRRQSLIGDAISHVGLPGIVGAYLLTGTLSSTAMFLGASTAALVAVALIELIRRLARVENGAAMGVVFTTLFALGVLMLEQSDSRNLHLDVEHVLYGNLESLIWLRGTSWGAFLDPVALAGLPPQIARLGVVLALVAGAVTLFWRPLALGTFDPGFAESVGAYPRVFNLLLVTLVAVAAVAAFDAVGAIIVIAMFICPPAAARLMTDRLSVQLRWSLAFASLSAVLGYILAGDGPLWLGTENSVSAAGMIAVVSGVILGLAACFGPKRRAIL